MSEELFDKAELLAQEDYKDMFLDPEKNPESLFLEKLMSIDGPIELKTFRLLTDLNDEDLFSGFKGLNLDLMEEEIKRAHKRFLLFYKLYFEHRQEIYDLSTTFSLHHPVSVFDKLRDYETDESDFI